MEMSLTRALNELKVIDKRIEDAIESFNALGTSVNKKMYKLNMTIQEFEENVKSSYNQIVDLITRRNNIKTKLVIANANTNVTINGRTYTIAEAIERKQSIKIDLLLLNKLQRTQMAVTNEVWALNESAARQLASMMEKTLGKESSSIKKEEYDAIANPFMERNEGRVVDPLGITKIIEKIRDDTISFTSEVDITLSEVNAKTFISVD